MRILNLGCGGKTCSHPDIVNIDWSLSLRLHRHRFTKAVLKAVLTGDRLKRFESTPSNILVHNLRNGIPFDDGSVDVVYHSHMLEHLDRANAELFIREAYRVLRPEGVHRIVVPDLEQLASEYLQHLEICKDTRNAEEIQVHDDYVGAMIEQCTRRDAAATAIAPPWRRPIERLMLGDARRRGETHQWMYDEISLEHMLESAGYKTVVRVDYATSRVPNWAQYGLDTDASGNQYKPKSLYVEAIK